MPTLTQTLRAKQSADRAAIVAQRKLEKAIARQEAEIESLKVKLARMEGELANTRHILSPAETLVSTWKEDWEAEWARIDGVTSETRPLATEVPVRTRKIARKSFAVRLEEAVADEAIADEAAAESSPDYPPVLDTDMVYMEIFHSSWEKGKKLILPVPITGREPYRYRDDGEYQLYSSSDDRLLQDEFFSHYQHMWKHQRIMLGYHMIDTYWGRNVSNGSWKSIGPHNGGFCTRPQDRVLVKKGTRGGRYRSIGCYREYEGEMRFVSDWDHTPVPHDDENPEYRYLYDLRGDALIAALDRLILGEGVVQQ